MRTLAIGFMGALLAALFITFFVLMAERADGNGGHGVCDGGVVSIEGTDDLVIYDAGDGVIDGVCVKAGNTVQHELFVVDFNNECYTVRGIGTSAVVVTREGRGRECQGLSHIDLLISLPTPTPEPTLMPTPVPTITPTPTPVDTPTATATPTVSATTTPTPKSTPTTTSGPETLTTPTPTSIAPVSTPILVTPLALPSTGSEGSVGGPIELPSAGAGALIEDAQTRSNALTWGIIMVGLSALVFGAAIVASHFTRKR